MSLMETLITRTTPAPPKLIVYGPPGVGKTSFAASAGAVLLDCENGAGAVAAVYDHLRSRDELDAFDLILIDKAHLIPPDGEGRYRTFLAEARTVNPNVRLVGLTATPYRMTGPEIRRARRNLPARRQGRQADCPKPL